LRYLTVLLLLIAISAVLQPHVPIAAAQQVTTELTLYAHTDPSAVQVGGRVLSLTGNATSRHSADVRDGLAFVLVPPLSASLRILGTISVYVWLQSSESLRGTLQVSISEVTANASVIEIRSASVTVGVSTNPFQVIFGLGAVDHTLAVGSTLKLEARFTTVRPVPVLLLWDDPAAATRVVFDAEALPRIILSITDATGKASTVFPGNGNLTTGLVAKVSIEDPFHGANIRTVLLTVANSTAFLLVKDAPMNLTSGTERPFHLDYALPIAVPSGEFNVTVSVQDVAERKFSVSEEITVTRFYTLVLSLLDAQQRALSGLNVSALALGELVDEVATNSSGRATMRVPSSQAVGPILLQVRDRALVILSRSIDVESDSVVLLVADLTDWSVFVRLQGLGTPMASARVDLYLNDTFVASATTDVNGAAHFTAVPPGQYVVSVSSFLASERFAGVTHSHEPEQTVLELHILSSDTTVLLLGGIAIVVALAVFRASRRKTKRYGHLGELLGGTFPQSSLTMIVGPSGSGKSLLLQNILADFLRLGRRCVFVSNSELPSKIRERLARMGLDAQKFQSNKTLAFIDAYSGATGAASSEKYSVQSARDLTTLGVQLTGCLEELGESGNVFFDSLTSAVAPGALERGFDFIEYYGARTKNSGGTFLYVASTTIEPQMLSRLEELSDCVLQMDKYVGPGGIRGRLLVKKARDLEHEQGWVGFRFRSGGRMEFVSLPSEAS
jgi:KaiC/GvpD/RAD55 family RecA-like ATPase